MDLDIADAGVAAMLATRCSNLREDRLIWSETPPAKLPSSPVSVYKTVRSISPVGWSSSVSASVARGYRREKAKNNDLMLIW